MMNESKSYKGMALETMYDFKHAPNAGSVIDCSFGSQSYRLTLLTTSHLEDQQIIQLCAKWRKQHEDWFPARFTVTVEGTAGWLKNGVVETPDRLLFMISVNGAYLGHVGLFRFEFDDRTCEIDNIVRGESGYPGLIGYAIAYMMRWCSNRLGLKWYTLQTFSNNERSLSLYLRLGFREVKRVPLLKSEAEGRVEWVDAPADYRGPVER